MISQFEIRKQKQKPLGVYLVEAGLITPAQIKTALDYQKVERRRLGEILASQGWINQKTIEYIIEKVVLSKGQVVEKKSHLDNNSSQNLIQVEQASQAELNDSDSLIPSDVPSSDFNIYFCPKKNCPTSIFRGTRSHPHMHRWAIQQVLPRSSLCFGASTGI